ncbi:MAG: metallophosphoesterase [bacterium]
MYTHKHFDLIGDIHGYADELAALLLKMGYVCRDGVYSHSTRTALFIGDYIDRGPKIRETLAIVKSMVDSGNAIALLGNHEYNALCYYYQNPDGSYLREHNKKNAGQVHQTLKQFENHPAEYKAYLDWFLTLPLYYESANFRAVHACWDNASIEVLRSKLPDDRLTEELLRESTVEDTPFYNAIDITLKGKEITLPVENSYTDIDGQKRREIRLRWWDDPLELTFASASVVPIENLPEDSIHHAISHNSEYYNESEKIVFFGHYGLEDDPKAFRHNVFCLDYGIAKDGKLVAYRLDDETEVDNSKIVF